MCRAVSYDRRVWKSILLDYVTTTADDEVVLLGETGHGAESAIRIEELAVWASTIPHEVLTNINTRVPRIYLNESR
jgi:alanine racemase